MHYRRRRRSVCVCVMILMWCRGGGGVGRGRRERADSARAVHPPAAATRGITTADLLHR